MIAGTLNQDEVVNAARDGCRAESRVNAFGARQGGSLAAVVQEEDGRSGLSRNCQHRIYRRRHCGIVGYVLCLDEPLEGVYQYQHGPFTFRTSREFLHDILGCLPNLQPYWFGPVCAHVPEVRFHVSAVVLEQERPDRPPLRGSAAEQIPTRYGQQ
jgi:hypothetical protein